MENFITYVLMLSRPYLLLMITLFVQWYAMIHHWSRGVACLSSIIWSGYPGHEKYMRKAVKKVLGEEKYEFFFDRVSIH